MNDGISREKLQGLFAEFEQDAVHWRAQSVTKDGDKAMALAYIDARDVMDRLDAVCGAENWQDRYEETPKGRLICTLSINIEGYWVNKSDGAGDTDVEGDKGAISDALKRAAVKWGIGRYLYDLKSPWVPCESYEKNGKKHWKKWTANPWDFVRGSTAPKPKADTPALITDGQRDQIKVIADAAGVALKTILQRAGIADLRELPADKYASVLQKLNLTIQQNKQKEAA
jgi:hypothetical protein